VVLGKSLTGHGDAIAMQQVVVEQLLDDDGNAADAEHSTRHAGYRRDIGGTHLSHPSYLFVGRKSGGGQQLNQGSLAIVAQKTLADWLGHLVNSIRSVRHSSEGRKRQDLFGSGIAL